jgi:hypothetical protein
MNHLQAIGLGFEYNIYSIKFLSVNDVEILMAALIVFRKEFMEKSKRLADADGNVDRKAFNKPHNGLDPLRESMTIASSSIKHFKMNHLPFNHLAIVPERSYQTKETQSLIALKFLQYLAETKNAVMRTRDSAGGEKQIGQYKLDGWVEEEKLGIEVHGCMLFLFFIFFILKHFRLMAWVHRVFSL